MVQGRRWEESQEQGGTSPGHFHSQIYCATRIQNLVAQFKFESLQIWGSRLKMLSVQFCLQTNTDLHTAQPERRDWILIGDNLSSCQDGELLRLKFDLGQVPPVFPNAFQPLRTRTDQPVEENVEEWFVCFSRSKD